ncbi:uncharacterized protein BDZ99DRAFT_465093 [Mytilinidion resinicola]|uniref:Secreted protein n=1 Tax=Mytilinidion resinicola TaxID=574789 RepID=A0A6A6YEB6_9PEZI|nr:uncharacterized protein BDZ99DRAFT_465093 [Mytilinidion resinicola]KAF2807161.1 hypothetical protein BDZ99DRAFT_465093 [Mytilinidion resinicola]
MPTIYQPHSRSVTRITAGFLAMLALTMRVTDSGHSGRSHWGRTKLRGSDREQGRRSQSSGYTGYKCLYVVGGDSGSMRCPRASDTGRPGGPASEGSLGALPGVTVARSVLLARRV